MPEELSHAPEHEIIQDWMIGCCYTIKTYDHKAHMNYISKNVKVYGIEGFDEITYDDWFAQCEQEFKDKVIKDVSYDGLHVKKVEVKRLYFSTVEIIEANDGAEIKHGIDIVLAQEEDGQWRVIKETLLDDVDARKEGLPL
jgi:hypothetical protein